MAARPDAETLLTTILEGIGLPFYAVDGDWRICLCNRAAERHFGRTAEQMIGTILWESTAVWFTTDREMQQVIGNRRAIEMLRLPREIDLSRALDQPAGFSVFRNGIEVPPQDGPCTAPPAARRCRTSCWRSASTMAIAACC